LQFIELLEAGVLLAVLDQRLCGLRAGQCFELRPLSAWSTRKAITGP
jgi:hypothetical protein